MTTTVILENNFNFKIYYLHEEATENSKFSINELRKIGTIQKCKNLKIDFSIAVGL